MNRSYQVVRRYNRGRRGGRPRRLGHLQDDEPDVDALALGVGPARHGARQLQRRDMTDADRDFETMRVYVV